MVDYIDQHRDQFGVEPICDMLQLAPSTYYAAKRRESSARAVRDAVMMQVLMVLWVANRKGLRGAQAVEGGPPGRPGHRP